MENMIGITLETGVGVQSAILHVCRVLQAVVQMMVNSIIEYCRLLI